LSVPDDDLSVGADVHEHAQLFVTAMLVASTPATMSEPTYAPSAGSV